jgi:hypothetical protein
MSSSFEDQIQELFNKFGLDIGNVDTYKGSLDSSVKEMAFALLPSVAIKTGRNAEELRRSLRKVNLDRRLLIDGRTTTQDNWRTYEISISKGLMLFHHKMVKLFVSRVSVVGDGQKMVEETRISHDEAVSISRRLMTSFWEGDFFETPSFFLTSLTKGQIILASRLLFYSELFVIAHEFGHIVMHVSPECIKRELLILKGAEESMVRPALGKNQCSSEPDVLRNWMEEIAADYIGINLCANPEKDPVVKSIIQASGTISLMMCDMLEKYRRKVAGDDSPDQNHPPSELRLEVLQTMLDWPAGMDFSSVFREFSQYIMAAI